MDKIFENSILFDLYGGLLSKKEQTVYEYHVNDDLSFTEIGEELSISRQAAYDLFKNADKKIKDIEKKLKLSVRLKNIEKCAKEIKDLVPDNQKIIKLSNIIINNTLKGGNN